jgi:hypothetical protein
MTPNPSSSALGDVRSQVTEGLHDIWSAICGALDFLGPAWIQDPHPRYYIIVTGLLLIATLLIECDPREHQSVARMRLSGALSSFLELGAFLYVAVALCLEPRTSAKFVVAGSFALCVAITLFRELHQRRGDRLAASILGALAVTWQFAGFIIFAGSILASWLTLLIMSPIAFVDWFFDVATFAEEIGRSKFMASMAQGWMVNFAGLMFCLCVYYFAFCWSQAVLQAHGFSWFDPPNWRTALHDRKYRWALSLRGKPAPFACLVVAGLALLLAGLMNVQSPWAVASLVGGIGALGLAIVRNVEPRESRLADTKRLVYLRHIVGGVTGVELDARIDRVARIEPFKDQPREFAFSIIGDPGEGDTSQLRPISRISEKSGVQGKKAVFEKSLRTLAEIGKEMRVSEYEESPYFLIISSDVVYPAGELMDYERAVYRPYATEDPRPDIPIYGIPGNHDWYNDLKGFFLNFTYPAAHAAGSEWAESLRSGPWAYPLRLFRDVRWRQVEQLRRKYSLDKLGGDAKQPRTHQRLSFFEMGFDKVPLTILGVDTGCTGSIDAVQESWLRRRLESSRGRGHVVVVILSEPLYVDGRFVDRGRLRELYEIIRQHEVDVIMGGDTHAYQHYMVKYEVSGREHVAHHIVNGGGGAYLEWPMDYTWRLANAWGAELDRRFVYVNKDQRGRGAPNDADSVTVCRIFPTAEDMLEKFRGNPDENRRIRRWLLRREPTLLQWGLTMALDHDREPQHQSFIMARAWAEDAAPAAVHLELTPWFTDKVSNELRPQPPIRISRAIPGTREGASSPSRAWHA